jgi:hypothetical protein
MKKEKEKKNCTGRKPKANPKKEPHKPTQEP